MSAIVMKMCVVLLFCGWLVWGGARRTFGVDVLEEVQGFLVFFVFYPFGVAGVG